MTRFAWLVMLLMLAAGAHGAQNGGAVNPSGGNGGGGNNDGAGNGNGNGNGGNTVTPGGGAVVAATSATAGQRPLFGNAGGGSVPAKTPERAGTDNSRELKKPALPEAIEVKTLDSSKFDRAAPRLKLTTKQNDSIEKAKAQIRADGEKLSAAQDEARAQYTQATDEAAYRDASRKVHDSADACREFRPDVKFECALDKILSEDQARTYRQ